MSENRGLLSSGLTMVARNKRYIVWFWLLNLTLAEFGTGAFRRSAHAVLDHSLAADKLVHGFHLATMFELFARPEFGQMSAMTMPAFYFAFIFLLATALFLPGVFEGYASGERLPRDDFFHACGRNLWRFVRLMIIAGIVIAIVAGALFGIQGLLLKKVAESTNEVFPFQVHMASLAVIFLIMTTIRIWFDLAEVDIVLKDQRAVRKSIWAGLRHTFRSLFRLLANYVVITIIAAIVLVGGLWAWERFVASTGVLSAFLLAQVILFLLLIPRFWQRGVAVSYWQQKMMAPAAAITPAPILLEPLPVMIPEPTPPSPETPPSTPGI